MKNINQHNINEWFFDLVEGNLSSADESRLYSFVEKNTEFKKDLDLWLETIYKNNEFTDFSGKELLLKKSNFFKTNAKYIAASLLFLGLGTASYIVLNNQKPVENTKSNSLKTVSVSKPKIEKTFKKEITETVFNVESPKKSVKAKVKPNIKTEIKEEPLLAVEYIESKKIEFEPIQQPQKIEMSFVEFTENNESEPTKENQPEKRKKTGADVIEIENVGF